MRRYIVIFPNNSISAGVLQRLRSTNHFELYPNVFFVRGEFASSHALYDFLQGTDTSSQRMVVFLVTDDYWGYTNRDFWPWIGVDN